MGARRAGTGSPTCVLVSRTQRRKLPLVHPSLALAHTCAALLAAAACIQQADLTTICHSKWQCQVPPAKPNATGDGRRDQSEACL